MDHRTLSPDEAEKHLLAFDTRQECEQFLENFIQSIRPEGRHHFRLRLHDSVLPGKWMPLIRFGEFGVLCLRIDGEQWFSIQRMDDDALFNVTHFREFEEAMKAVAIAARICRKFVDLGLDGGGMEDAVQEMTALIKDICPQWMALVEATDDTRGAVANIEKGDPDVGTVAFESREDCEYFMRETLTRNVREGAHHHFHCVVQPEENLFVPFIHFGDDFYIAFRWWKDDIWCAVQKFGAKHNSTHHQSIRDSLLVTALGLIGVAREMTIPPEHQANFERLSASWIGLFADICPEIRQFAVNLNDSS